MANNGWGDLGAALLGNGQGTTQAYQKGQENAARLGLLLANAQKATDERMAADNRQAKISAAGYAPEQADLLANLFAGGIDPRQLSGYAGDVQEQGFRGNSVASALAGDWGGANANLMGVANGPVDLASVQGQNLINNRLLPGGGGISTTEQGQAGIGADKARAVASYASANSSNASAQAALGRLAIARGQYDLEREGNWAPGRNYAKATSGAGAASEGERNASGFYQRMVAANSELKNLTDAGYDPANLRDYLSTGTLLGNYSASTQGQQYHQAAMNWVRANLRKESGAAIGKDEAAQEIKNYFPQPGDSPEVITQKARSREVTEGAMRQAAGRALSNTSLGDALSGASLPPSAPVSLSDALGGVPSRPAIPAPAPVAGPPVGAVQDGYRYKGGDPSSPTSWERL